MIFEGLMNSNRMIWKLVLCANYLCEILMDNSYLLFYYRFHYQCLVYIIVNYIVDLFNWTLL